MNSSEINGASGPKQALKTDYTFIWEKLAYARDSKYVNNNLIGRIGRGKPNGRSNRNGRGNWNNGKITGMSGIAGRVCTTGIAGATGMAGTIGVAGVAGVVVAILVLIHSTKSETLV